MVVVVNTKAEDMKVVLVVVDQMIVMKAIEEMIITVVVTMIEEMTVMVVVTVVADQTIEDRRWFRRWQTR